jgi:tRNA(Ile)-lysidine synthase
VEEIRRHWPGPAELAPGAKVVVGVSGGPDSLALLSLLKDLGHPLVVAHLDHGLRPESEAEAEFVRQLAFEWGLPCVIGRERVADWAKEHRQSVEEGGRVLRYRFLVRVALQVDAKWIAVGHTADDQAETVLMHFLRGSGSEGLRGMAMVQDLGVWVEGLDPGRVFLVRPLLKVTREQTEAYCRERGLVARRDPTNLGPAYLRGRMRSDLLPALKRYNPRLRSALCRLADVMAGEVEVIEAEVDRAWLQLGVGVSPDQVWIPRKEFLAQPIGIRRGLVRRACRGLLPGVRDLAYRHVEQALEFSQHPSQTGRAEICQGLGLRLSGDCLILQREVPGVRPLPDWTGAEVPRQGRIRLEGLEWVIEARSVRQWDWRRVQSGAGRWEAWLDRDRVEGNLTVRVRARGDRFRPLGMDQEVRLGDFLSAHHLPADLRDRWPLICDGLGIVWIPGLQIGERPKLRPVTRQALHLRVWREG